MLVACDACGGFGEVRLFGKAFRECKACEGLGVLADDPPRQSRKMSLAEVCFGTAIGFVVAMATTAIVFPWFNIHASLRTSPSRPSSPLFL